MSDDSSFIKSSVRWVAHCPLPSDLVPATDPVAPVFSWYVVDMSRQRSETILKHEDREGCFVVRNSSSKGMYTLSLFTKV